MSILTAGKSHKKHDIIKGSLEVEGTRNYKSTNLISLKLPHGMAGSTGISGVPRLVAHSRMDFFFAGLRGRKPGGTFCCLKADVKSVASSTLATNPKFDALLVSWIGFDGWIGLDWFGLAGRRSVGCMLFGVYRFVHNSALITVSSPGGTTMSPMTQLP